MAFLGLLLEVIFLDETYAPVILVQKAFRMRIESKNMAIYAAHERQSVSFHKLLDQNLTRPAQLLIGELIVLLVSLYMAFI